MYRGVRSVWEMSKVENCPLLMWHEVECDNFCSFWTEPHHHHRLTLPSKKSLRLVFFFKTLLKLQKRDALHKKYTRTGKLSSSSSSWHSPDFSSWISKYVIHIRIRTYVALTHTTLKVTIWLEFRREKSLKWNWHGLVVCSLLPLESAWVGKLMCVRS